MTRTEFWKTSDLTRFFLIIIAISLMVGGFLLAYKGDAASATITYVAAVFCLVFAFLSKFKKFSGLGFSGETWEQKMQEADELITRLRNLSTVVAEPVFIAMARLGRWDSHLTRRERYEITKKLEGELERNGVSPTDIRHVRGELDRINACDMAKPLFESASRKLRELTETRQQAVQAFPQPIVPGAEYSAAIQRLQEARDAQALFTNFGRAPTSSLLTMFRENLENCAVFTAEERTNILQEFDEEIKDLKHYIDNREFRRLNVWLDGKD